MIDAMKIGVSLTLQGDALDKLKKFTASVGTSATQAERLNAALEKLEKRLSYLNPMLNTFAKKMGEASASMDGLASGAARSAGAFGAFTNNVSAAGARMGAAARSASALKGQLIALNTVAAGGGGGRGGARDADFAAAAGGAGRRGGGGGRHGARFDHFGREMGGGRITAMGAMLASGNVGLAAAFAGILAIKDSYQAQGRFEQATAQLTGQGFGATANAQAVSAARSMNIRGVSATDALQAINDAATVTRNIPSAIALAPTVAKMEFANKINYAQKGKKFTNADEMRMLQFAEIRTGSTDPAVISKALNQIEQAYSTDAARLSTNDLRTGGRQGQLFIQNLSDRGFASILPLYQTSGGQRTSTGLATMQSSLFKGQNLRTGKKAVEELERLGVYGKNGKLKDQYVNQIATDPVGFIHDTLAPLMAAKGINTPAGDAKEFSILFTQSTARIASAVMEMWPRIQAQINMLPKASGVQAGYLQALTTNPGHIEAFEKSWDTMMTNIGRFSSPLVNKGMNALIDFFDAVSALTTNPGAYIEKEVSPTNISARFKRAVDDAGEIAKHLVPGSVDAVDAVKNAATAQQAASSQLNINIDGRKMAEAIIPHINLINSNAMSAALNRYNYGQASSPSVVGQAQ